LIRISISELIHNGVVEWFGQGWKRMNLKAIGGPVLMAESRGVTARIRVPSGTTGIWILRHNWSGVVKVQSYESVQRIDLHNQAYDDNFVVPLSCPYGGPSEIEITVDCDEGTPWSRAQVWILGLAFNDIPLPRAKSNTLSNTTRLIRGDWGHFLVLNNDHGIPTEIINQGAWALGDIELFKKHVSAGDCVLDIGAHVGHHAIVFSKLVGHAGFVLAVESQRLMFQLLNANCVINGAANIVPIHAAASDHRGVLSLYPINYAVLENFGKLGVNLDSARISQTQGESVLGLCADDLVDEYCENRRIGFIKVDAQAFEKYVLRGLLRTITKYRPKIFFEIAPFWMFKAGYDYREIYQLLSTLGYKFEHFIKLNLGIDGFPDYEPEYRGEWDALACPIPSIGIR